MVMVVLSDRARDQRRLGRAASCARRCRPPENAPKRSRRCQQNFSRLSATIETKGAVKDATIA